jgi:hypothetical protein
VTVHVLPGEGIVQALEQVGFEEKLFFYTKLLSNDLKY